MKAGGRVAKNKKWIHARHMVVRNIAYALLYPFSRLAYGVTVEKHRDDRQYLILLNHQTTFDQFFVGMAFKKHLYYLATEDIFSNGWVSSLIRYLVAPIPIKKQTTDVHAVMNCIRVAREGGSIAIAPEGNRTYSGKTEYMNPAITSLVRKLGLPLALFRIEGGYGVQPRWGDVLRKGKMRAFVSRVIEPEEYADMTNEELYEIIKNELYVNEACADATFYHKRSAEYLERLVYVCPYCGLSRFESRGEVVECCSCHRKVRYLPTKELKGEGFEFPFAFVDDWYAYQNGFVNRLDMLQYLEQPLYHDTAAVSEVVVYKKKVPVRRSATLTLYGDRLVIDENGTEPIVYRFDDVTAVTVLGRNKANIYYDGKVFQLKGDKRFNAIKYVNLYYRYTNIKKGDEHGQFLGL